MGMPVEALMEKVGIGISSWILDRQGLIENGAIVLVGPGHNGGDGLVVARELYMAGVDISIWCPFPLKKELTQKHFDYAMQIGIENLEHKPDSNSDLLWIEALFGLGQSRIISDEIVHLLNSKKRFSPDKLISIDVPAGLDSDSGKTISNTSCKPFSTISLGLFTQAPCAKESPTNKYSISSLSHSLSCVGSPWQVREYAPCFLP